MCNMGGSCGTEEVELCPLCKNDLGEHCEEADYSDTIQRNNKVVKCNHFKLKNQGSEKE